MTKNSGKSKSREFPTGKRRMFQEKELAPRSLRNGKRVCLSDMDPKTLEKLGLI